MPVRWGSGGSRSVRRAPDGRNLLCFPGSPSWPCSRAWSMPSTRQQTTIAMRLFSVRGVVGRDDAQLRGVDVRCLLSGPMPATTGRRGVRRALGILAPAFSPTNGRFYLDASEAWVASCFVLRASLDAAVDLGLVAGARSRWTTCSGSAIPRWRITTMRLTITSRELTNDHVVTGSRACTGATRTSRSHAAGDELQGNPQRLWRARASRGGAAWLA